jgi:subtilisin-like proprotein convertase family protein
MRDIDILLVSPTGQKMIPLSDVGPNGAVNNTTLTLSDSAASSLGTGTVVSGTYKPTNIGTGDTFAAPAPTGPYGANLATFNGQPANGAWSLYVVDDSSGSTGSIGGGWRLTITTAPAAPTISGIANQATTTNSPTSAIPFTINDADTPVDNLTVSGSSNNTTLVPNANIAFGGSGANWTVTVSPAANQTGSATITVSVSDGELSTSTSFVVTVSSPFTGTQSFSNAAAITIPSVGNATPYPAVINVSGMGGTISNVTVTLQNLSHTYPADIDVLLVGPAGQKAVIFSDVGGGGDVNSVTVTLSDAAATALTATGQIVSGTFKPTNVEPGETGELDNFSAPAPGGPYGTALSTFNGVGANGTWSLYVVDDGPGDLGSFAGGWSLTITTVSGNGSAAPMISDIGDQWTTTNTAIAAIPFTMNDMDRPVDNLTLSAPSSNPTLVPANNIGFGGSGTNQYFD